MTDILSVLIWVQTVCKGYQQMTKVATSKERVKKYFISVLIWVQTFCKGYQQMTKVAGSKERVEK